MCSVMFNITGLRFALDVPRFNFVCEFSYMCKGSLLVLLPVYIVLLNAETIHK